MQSQTARPPLAAALPGLEKKEEPGERAIMAVENTTTEAMVEVSRLYSNDCSISWEEGEATLSRRCPERLGDHFHCCHKESKHPLLQ